MTKISKNQRIKNSYIQGDLMKKVTYHDIKSD